MGGQGLLKNTSEKQSWMTSKRNDLKPGKNLGFHTWKGCRFKWDLWLTVKGKPLTNPWGHQANVGHLGVFEVSAPGVHWGQQAEVKLHYQHSLPSAPLLGSSLTTHLLRSESPGEPQAN